MSKMSNYLENALINHVLRNTAMTSPTTVYLALFTSDPAENASGTELADGVDGYSRQAVTFDAPTDGVTQNSGLVSFTASGGNWGTITHLALFDASTGGNMLVYGPLDTSRLMNDGDTLEWAAGTLTVTFA